MSLTCLEIIKGNKVICVDAHRAPRGESTYPPRNPPYTVGEPAEAALKKPGPHKTLAAPLTQKRSDYVVRES